MWNLPSFIPAILAMGNLYSPITFRTFRTFKKKQSPWVKNATWLNNELKHFIDSSSMWQMPFSHKKATWLSKWTKTFYWFFIRSQKPVHAKRQLGFQNGSKHSIDSSSMWQKTCSHEKATWLSKWVNDSQLAKLKKIIPSLS